MSTTKEVVRHTPTPWAADVGDRLSDGSDCWVVDSESGSIAEMMCPVDVEEANARFIVTAANSYDSNQETIKALRGTLDAIARECRDGAWVPEDTLEHIERIARAALAEAEKP